MSRYNYDVYAVNTRANYLVLFDIQWQILECERLEPRTDLRKAAATAVDRLTKEGWRFEAPLDFGFAFLNRGGIRRLLILTERDPYDQRPQSFSPFK